MSQLTLFGISGEDPQHSFQFYYFVKYLLNCYKTVTINIFITVIFSKKFGKHNGIENAINSDLTIIWA